MSKPSRNDYPIGIPLRPPLGWKGRGTSVPPPLPTRARKSPLHSVVLKAGLVALMVFVCTTVGWLAVGTPRRPKAKSPPVQVASVPVAKPIPREDPKPVVPEQPAVPKAVVPEPTKEPTPPPGTMLTYERDILPIVKRSCLNCHGGAKKRGKLDLSTYAAARKGGEEGTSLVPGKPADSPFLTTILAGKMPPGGKKLPSRDVQLIREWIRTGARSDASK